MVSLNNTPTPTQEYAPITVELPDWFDLSSHSTNTLLKLDKFGTQSIDLNYVTSQVQTDVDVVIHATRRALNGTVDEPIYTLNTEGIQSFGNKVTISDVVNQQLIWEINNRSANAYTGANAFQAVLNYTVSRLTVAEKLQRDVYLTSHDEKLASKYGLTKQVDAGIPITESTVTKPTLDDKEVVKDITVTEKFDISNSGSDHSVQLVDENNLESRNLVAYVTSLKINSQNYSHADDLTIRLQRQDNNTFYDIHTYGMPGFSNNQYKADLFVPFPYHMTAVAFAPTTTPTGVEVQLEYSLVERTTIEKALYGLQGEVPDKSIYNKVSEQIEAGIPVNV